MKKINLDEKYIDFIKRTILALDDKFEIYIFGSRVQDKSLEYSDVDIALKLEVKIPVEKIIKLKAVFEDSNFPYKVDIIDLNSIEEYFYNIIEKDLVRVQ